MTENYRPISILLFLAKILEKLTKVRAISFINDNKILFNQQFGFRAGYSTTDAILRLTDDCVTALDQGLHIIVIFLDFSKAFDTVNKDIMVKKLDRLGFKGQVNDYFRSYLTDRQINVVLDGQESVLKTVNIGLPQGSVSAPWLFSLYINDMHRTSDKLNFIHFADDTTIYRSGPDLATLCNEITEELTRVDDWLKANRLSLNIDKTNFMILTHGKYDERDKYKNKRHQT